MASKFLNISTDNTLGGVSPSDEIVSSQKAIKDYIDNQGGGAAIDNSTITKNSSNELQAEAVLNMNSASGATNPLYHWQGTLAEYTAQNIEVLHPDWVCIVTDDSATIAWGDITGSISNQADLQNALDAKQATLVSGTNIKTINSTSLLGSGDIAVQETLVSGTNIKTINNTSILGSGDISISANPSIDGKSITTNSSDELQTVGVINQNDTTTALKVWSGDEADLPVTKDANTFYATEETVSVNLLDTLYPVGSIYITTNAACPLSTLIAGSTWSLVSSGIVQAGDIPCKGNGMTLGLTNGTTNYGLYFTTNNDYSSSQNMYGVNAGTSISQAQSPQQNYSGGITTDPTKSGIIADTSSLTLAVNIFERTA